MSKSSFKNYRRLEEQKKLQVENIVSLGGDGVEVIEETSEFYTYL